MYQTAYTGISNLLKAIPYLGGVCQFWFIPVNEVESIPNIDPVNQYLLAEPVLKTGKVWRGPVPVPDAQLGFTETQENAAAGPYYKQQLQAQHPGDVPAHRVNLDNMAYGQYLVVAKLRSGGFYVLLGSLDSPLNFDHDFSTGPGSNDDAKTKIAFTGESIYRAPVIPNFAGNDSGFITPCDGPPPSPPNQSEIISFTAQTLVTIDWTPTRISKFGVFPEVECYVLGPDTLYYKAAVQPYIDAAPPSFTQLYFSFSGATTGFILIK